MEMDPQSSQNDHIVLRPSGPAAQAMRSLGIWEQVVLLMTIHSIKCNRKDAMVSVVRYNGRLPEVNHLPMMGE